MIVIVKIAALQQSNRMSNIIILKLSEGRKQTVWWPDLSVNTAK